MDSRRYKRRKRREEKRKAKKQAFCKSFKSEETILDYDKLYRSGMICKQGVRWKASTQKFLYDCLLNCYNVKMEIVNGDKVHHGFVVFVLIERGKARKAYSIHIRERVLQRTLSDYVLMPFITKTIVDRNCASIKGKGEIHAEEALKKDLRRYWKTHHDNDGWIIFLDVSKYFYNINRTDILRRFADLGDSTIQNVMKQFSDAYNVYECFEYNKGYGLGTQFVQVAGIYAMSPIDHHIKECEKDGAMSTRYMDDTYILATVNNKEALLNKYITICEKAGFPMNKEKCTTVPINKPFVWLKKLYHLTNNGKVVVRIGYKAVTRERHAIMNRMEWVNKGRISYFSYHNQVRSWLINVKKHYQSSAPSLVIERTFQYCFYRLLEANEAEYIKRLNKLLSNLEKEAIVVLVHIATLYIAFANDAVVLARLFEKQNKTRIYFDENKIGKIIMKMEQSCLNYVVVKENEKDKLILTERVSSFNSYRYLLNAKT